MELQEKSCFLGDLCYTIKFVGFKQDRNIVRYKEEVKYEERRCKKHCHHRSCRPW